MVFELQRGIRGLRRNRRRSFGAAHKARMEFYRKVSGFVRRVCLFIGIVFAVAGAIIAVYTYTIYLDLPDTSKLNSYIPNETTKIISRDGVMLAELHKEENRVIVPLEKISDHLKKAVIAIEDKRFYRHHGIDWIGIMRAVIIDLKEGEAVQGASTLTQQLVKNVFLHKEKKIRRKIAEVLLSLQVERHRTKDEILEMYLNEVYWGHNAYGIESASRIYFGRSAETLTLAESAMLVGLIRGPELYSPYKDYDQAIFRQKVVLKQLLNQHIITRQEYDEALKQPIVLKGRPRTFYKAPYFVSYILEQLMRDYGESSLYISGMNVYTTLDYRMQRIAERVVQEIVAEGEANGAKFDQAALLAIEPNTGHIVAMVGGSSYGKSQYNKTVHAYRQPGSAFKPFTYLAALERGYTPSSYLNDTPVAYGSYCPRNYHNDYKGVITMRRALEISQNVPAVRLMSQLGPYTIIETARRLGLTTPMQPYLALTLGACEVTMLEMTSAYGVFAAEGIRAEPISISRVDNRDNISLQVNKVKRHRVADAGAVNMLVDMMTGVVENGTARAARLEDRQAAGKTGTTSDYRDAWFIGFVPQLVVAAWVGNEDNTTMKRVTGGMYPARMWKMFMEKALANTEPVNFPAAPGTVMVKVCKASGMKATSECPHSQIEYKRFMYDNIPGRECSVHVPLIEATTSVVEE